MTDPDFDPVICKLFNAPREPLGDVGFLRSKNLAPREEDASSDGDTA